MDKLFGGLNAKLDTEIDENTLLMGKEGMSIIERQKIQFELDW